jgi:hypothetical protein
VEVFHDLVMRDRGRGGNSIPGDLWSWLSSFLPFPLFLFRLSERSVMKNGYSNSDSCFLIHV